MRVTIFVPPQVHLLEVAGVRDALFEANERMVTDDPYQVQVVAEEADAIVSASGQRFLADATLAEARAGCDTLIVTGSFGVPAPPSPALAGWLRAQAGSARRYGSVCTGAHLLAGAGLLDGRRVATHWQYADRLASDFPALTVEPDRIVVRDGPTFSSAGVAAAIDLALALIEEDHGRGLALWVARRLVVFLKRPGGQSQFSVHMLGQPATSDAIRRVRRHVSQYPAGDLSLAALAGVAGMSVRSFTRSFTSETGMSPAAWVEGARVEIARQMLEQDDLPVKTVAHRAGFGSTSAARRAFVRRLGCTPAEYRQRFRTSEDFVDEDAEPGAESDSALA